MQLLESLKEHSEELGDGISPVAISDLEARLDIALPDDFKEYLKAYNYAEIFGDPIYSINPELEDVDLYTQNKNKEHLPYGFLEVFANDIDGTIYIRPDTGAVYTAGFGKPIAKSFTGFTEELLSQG